MLPALAGAMLAGVACGGAPARPATAPPPLAFALYVLAAAILIFAYVRWRQARVEARLERLVEARVAEIKVLSGLLPICSSCKKIRDDDGYWEQIEGYIGSHSEAHFSHGICPDCLPELYPELSGEIPAPSFGDGGPER